jgi:hypothetical protein
MICVRLQGGLGNQLFQYAAGRALAQRHNSRLILDTSFLHQTSNKYTKRELELTRFMINARISNHGEFRKNSLWHRLPIISNWLSPWHLYVEKSFSFNSAFNNLPDNTYLAGYWQSFRYFSAIAEVIATDLQPIEDLSQLSKEIDHRIRSCESISVHVRRGDYVSLRSASNMHGALKNAYYSKANENIFNTLLKPHFFVFSDDSNWCKLNLRFPSESVTYITHNSGFSAWQDLILMSRCRHNIIANSSFSWWAAWLADQLHGTKDRLVIAPQQWFRHITINIKDRFPNHWKVVS